jgi:hypothetical protein
MHKREIKRRCDAIAVNIIDLIGNEGRDLPRETLIAIPHGVAACLAFAGGLLESMSHEMLDTAWRDIKGGEH